MKSGKEVNCLNSLWCVWKQLYNKYLKQLTELAERKLKGNLFQRPIAVIEKVLPASVALLYFEVTKLKSALRVFLECCWLFKFNSLFKRRFFINSHMLCEKRSKLGNQAFLLQRDIEVYNGSFISQALQTQSLLLQYELQAGKQTTKKKYM